MRWWNLLEVWLTGKKSDHWGYVWFLSVSLLPGHHRCHHLLQSWCIVLTQGPNQQSQLIMDWNHESNSTFPPYKLLISGILFHDRKLTNAWGNGGFLKERKWTLSQVTTRKWRKAFSFSSLSRTWSAWAVVGSLREGAEVSSLPFSRSSIQKDWEGHVMEAGKGAELGEGAQSDLCYLLTLSWHHGYPRIDWLRGPSWEK